MEILIYTTLYKCNYVKNIYCIKYVVHLNTTAAKSSLEIILY